MENLTMSPEAIAALLAYITAALAIAKMYQELKKIRAEADSLKGKLKHELFDTAFKTITQLRQTITGLRANMDTQGVKHDAEILLLKNDIVLYKRELKNKERIEHKAKIIIRNYGGNTGFFYDDPSKENKQ